MPQDAELPILCDYCDRVAAMFYPRRGPSERSFACIEHTALAAVALGARPGEARDEPLPGRNRFADLDLDQMLALWRRHRSAASALQPPSAAH